jgi:hypothetical protein
MLVSFVWILPAVKVQAEIVDFESTGLEQGQALTNQIAGLTFENTILAQAGAPVIAFQASGADIGAAPFDTGFFITDAVAGLSDPPWTSYTGPIVVKFDFPVFDLRFAICDIDQGPGLRETMTATVFSDTEGTTQLEQVALVSGEEGTGDGKVNNVAFAATGIRRLEIDVNNSTRSIGFALDNLEYSVVSIAVLIDIKPDSFPNVVNLGSNGVVPVAVLTTEDFDATTVDPETVTLAGAGVAVRGKGNKSLSHNEDVDGDGDVDLLVQVETENLNAGQFQDGYAILTGSTFDGRPIEGGDEITIVPPE